MIEILKAITPVVIGVLGGAVGSWFAMHFRMQETAINFTRERANKDEEAAAKLKLHYLGPLRSSVSALGARFAQIRQRLREGDTLLFDTLVQLELNQKKDPDDTLYNFWLSERDRRNWANNLGHFCLSTLRITSVYFYYAREILQKLPYVELSAGDDAEIHRHIIRVAKALGGPYGIWEELQDSIGEYIARADGTLRNYRDFCEQLFDSISYLDYSRLIDFYRDIRLKSTAELDEIQGSLESLEEFLATRTGVLLSRSG